MTAFLQYTFFHVQEVRPLQLHAECLHNSLVHLEPNSKESQLKIAFKVGMTHKQRNQQSHVLANKLMNHNLTHTKRFFIQDFPAK